MGTRSFPVGPGGTPKGGGEGVHVLDGAECRTGLRKEALAMETWGHIPTSAHPGCVPLFLSELGSPPL